MSAIQPETPCCGPVSLALTQEDADFLLHLLMAADPLDTVGSATVDGLLCRIAEAQRALSRQRAHHGPPGRREETPG